MRGISGVQEATQPKHRPQNSETTFGSRKELQLENEKPVRNCICKHPRHLNTASFLAHCTRWLNRLLLLLTVKRERFQNDLVREKKIAQKWKSSV